MSSKKPKKKALVLGAGPAGLAAAMALLDSKEYEVHVFQMGWRAGGKCATGREMPSARTRQNGSHYLFGCYHNAFKLIRRAHAVIAEKGGGDSKFGSFLGDFVARNLLVGAQGYGRLVADKQPELGRWFRYLPQNMASPGEGGKYPTPFDFLLMGWQFGVGLLIDYVRAQLSESDDEHFDGVKLFLRLLPVAPFEQSLWSRLVRGGLRPARWAFNLLVLSAYRVCGGTLRVLLTFVLPLTVRTWPDRFWRSRRDGLVKGMQRFIESEREKAFRKSPNASKALERLLILLEIGATVAVGFLNDELYLPGGFEKIDAIDLRDWLKKHGASAYAYKSALITTWYDATIAYEDGQQKRGRCSAGVALNAMIRSLLTYKGAFAYQMRAEVGDSLIAPTVKALELLGAHFHFYHRVAQIVVDPDAGVVERVVLGLQVPDPPREAEFIDVEFGPENDRQTRKAWPSIAQHSKAAAAADPPLDSYYSAQPTETRTLYRSGTAHAQSSTEPENLGDFDVIVSALPCGVLEDVLVNRDGSSVKTTSEVWAKVFANVKFTESQAVRMWLNRSLSELGWAEAPPILSGNDWPFSTWEDNSQAISIRNFPAGKLNELKTIATVFGPLETGARDTRHPDHPKAQLDVAHQYAQKFLDTALLGLWPGMSHKTEPRGLDWNAFIDLANGVGPARFAFQHVVANVGPSESYIVTFPGTLRYRPRCDESGFQNLYLAGDWTRNGVEAGTVEGAVISGLKAARAITGSSEVIIGGDDFDRGTVLG